MKLPVPREIRACELWHYGNACSQGRRYLKEAFGGRAECDLKTLDRVLDDSPGCVHWMLYKIAQRLTPTRVHEEVAGIALARLGSMDDAAHLDEMRIRVEIRPLISPGEELPVEVVTAIGMFVFLWRKDELRALAIKYFDIPETAEGSGS